MADGKPRLARKEPKVVKTPPGGVAAYAPPSAGPFRCGLCEYSNETATECNKPEVIKERGGKNAKSAPVAPFGCCNYFDKDEKKAGHVTTIGVLSIGRTR